MVLVRPQSSSFADVIFTGTFEMNAITPNSGCPNPNFCIAQTCLGKCGVNGSIDVIIHCDLFCTDGIAPLEIVVDQMLSSLEEYHIRKYSHLKKYDECFYWHHYLNSDNMLFAIFWKLRG